MSTVYADEPGADLSEFQSFELASGSMCTLASSTNNEIMDTVYPSNALNATDIYGYKLVVTDKSNDSVSNYLYYGGAEKQDLTSCTATEVEFDIPLVGKKTVQVGGAPVHVEVKVPVI